MRRRDFNLALLQAGAAAILAPRLIARTFSDGPPPLSELYAKAIVVDSLCAPLTDPDVPLSAEALAAVRHSGITAINFTISGPALDFEETVKGLAIVQKLVDDYPETFLIVRRHSDLARSKRENKLGIMLGFQQTAFLEQEPDRIDTFRSLGVRIMQLTYNKRGKFGDGCLEPANAGLTEAGLNAIRLMNRLGVAVDLSHSGYRTASDAIAKSAKPVLISHSGCAAVYAHPRNVPDEILKALADRGGYFGVYLMPYLVASPTVPTREHVLTHLMHAINVCGADHVGIGSDGGIQKVVLTAGQNAAFEQNMASRKAAGIAAPGEDRYPYVPDLNGPDHMQVIAEELAKRGQPASTIEKVLGANFQRVIGEIWGTN
jgi:membrane dipeptidase